MSIHPYTKHRHYLSVSITDLQHYSNKTIAYHRVVRLFVLFDLVHPLNHEKNKYSQHKNHDSSCYYKKESIRKKNRFNTQHTIIETCLRSLKIFYELNQNSNVKFIKRN